MSLGALPASSAPIAAAGDSNSGERVSSAGGLTLGSIVIHSFSQTRLGKNGSPVGEQLVLVSIGSCQHPMTSQRMSQIYSPALTTVWIGFPCAATSHWAKPAGGF